MIDLATEHEEYNPALELLASIPPHPDYVSLQDLAEDFGYEHIADVQLALRATNQPGGSFRALIRSNTSIPKGKGRRVASLVREPGSTITEDCDSYIERVYPPTVEERANVMGACGVVG